MRSLIAPITSFDPQDGRATLSSVMSPLLLWDPLLRRDPETHSKLVPALAESWESSADGLTHTLRLRKGVLFHDGAPLTADVVKWNLDRMLKRPTGLTPGLDSLLLNALDKVEVVDPATVKLTLIFPDPQFLEKLSFEFAVMLPKHLYDPKDAAGQQPTEKELVGTGAFVFSEQDPSASFTVKRNPKYWAPGLPWLSEVRDLVIPDASAALAAFRTGQIDMTRPASQGFRPQDMDFVQRELVDRGLAVTYEQKAFTHFTLVFNTLRKPFDNARVRYAMHLVIDRQRQANLFGANLVVQGGPMPTVGQWGIPPNELATAPGWRTPKDQDVAEARRIIKDAGFSNGFGMEVLVAAGLNADLAGALADDFRQIGIDLRVKVVSVTEARDLQLRGDFDSDFRARAEAFDDPSVIIMSEAHSTGVQNFGRYSNLDLDKLLGRQMVELDPAKRKDLVRQAQQTIIDQAPYIRVFWYNYFIGWRSEVRGFAPGPGLYTGYNDFYQVWRGQ